MIPVEAASKLAGHSIWIQDLEGRELVIHLELLVLLAVTFSHSVHFFKRYVEIIAKGTVTTCSPIIRGMRDEFQNNNAVVEAVFDDHVLVSS